MTVQEVISDSIASDVMDHNASIYSYIKKCLECLDSFL